MKQKFVQIAAFALILSLLAAGGASKASAAPPAAGTYNSAVIRVGLAYGSAAMEGANLINEVGSGYRFGYFDAQKQFVALGSTESTSISVVKTVNVGYNGSVSYTNYRASYAGSGGVVVGSAHLQLPGSYATFAEAQAAASAYPDGFPACIGGVFYARVGNFTTRELAQVRQAELAAAGVSAEVVGTSVYGLSVVTTGTNAILFQYDDLGSGTGLGVMPGAADDGTRCQTWFLGFVRYGGFRYERIGGGDITVVNLVGLDDYAKSVIPYEMNAGWQVEALKAQAVAARSYALSIGARHSAAHFDVCDTDHCQVYHGTNRATANSDAAVEQTAGQVATYNGKYAECYYSSSNGGASIDSTVIWGGDQSDFPYLVGKVDPYEAYLASSITDYVKSVTYTGSDLASRLRSSGYAPSGAVASVTVTARTNSGLPKEVTFTDSAGKRFTLTTVAVRKLLGSIRSYNYSFSGNGGGSTASSGGGLSVNGSASVPGTSGLYAIGANGDRAVLTGSAYVIGADGITIPESQAAAAPTQAGSATGTVFTFTTRGWGHNVGMSQYGALAMAKQGYTYDQILKFYYTGITVGYV